MIYLCYLVVPALFVFVWTSCTNLLLLRANCKYLDFVQIKYYQDKLHCEKIPIGFMVIRKKFSVYNEQYNILVYCHSKLEQTS